MAENLAALDLIDEVYATNGPMRWNYFFSYSYTINDYSIYLLRKNERTGQVIATDLGQITYPLLWEY